MNRVVCFALGISLLIASPALATNVAVVKGQLFINRGDGYQHLVDAASVFPGDLVMASPNSSGKIYYSDNCVVEVKPGAVVTVEAKPPCQTGGARLPNVSKPGYLIGGLIVGAIVGGGIALSGGGSDDSDSAKKLLDDDDDPASP